jgi:hypothetical protein
MVFFSLHRAQTSLASYLTRIWDSFPGIKRPGREIDHLSRSSAEVKNAWSYTATPKIHLHGVVVSEAQGQYYFMDKSHNRGDQFLERILVHFIICAADLLTDSFLLSEGEPQCVVVPSNYLYFRHLPISIARIQVLKSSCRLKNYQSCALDR